MPARRILLVEDSSEFRTQVKSALCALYSVTEAESEAAFRRVFRPYTFDLVILDMRLETGREGLRVLREILAQDELQPVIMVSAYGDTDAVLESAEAGALMFLHKQEFTPELLARMVEAILQQARVRRHLESLKNRLPVTDSTFLAGTNPMVRRAADLVQEAADEPDAVVVISGEPGSGQAAAAQLIHARSKRRQAAPFITGSASMLHQDGAVALLGGGRRNGAPRRKGLLERANGGVLFLNGFDSIATGLRETLGKALRDRALEIDDLSISLDLQLIAGVAANGSAAAIEELHGSIPGIRVLEIRLPALHERREDNSLLTAAFLHELRLSGDITARALSRPALDALQAYHWPGNLAELRNTVEFAAIQALVHGAEEILPEHLPRTLAAVQNGGIDGRPRDYRLHLARAELGLVEAALKKGRSGNKSQLAELLGYSDRFAFARRIRKALEVDQRFAVEFPRTAALFRRERRNVELEAA